MNNYRVTEFVKFPTEGYTCRHLHQRIEEHKGSAIGNHLKEEHDIAPDDIVQFFKILKKCQSKFDCLIFEMFLTKNWNQL